MFVTCSLQSTRSIQLRFRCGVRPARPPFQLHGPLHHSCPSAGDCWSQYLVTDMSMQHTNSCRNSIRPAAAYLLSVRDARQLR